MIRRAFTLIELLVAILVLLAVLLASGSIFSATSKVAGLGEANSDVNADLQAFEKSIRDDLHAISRDGFLMIRCVAVRNDIRRPTADSTRPLLDPTLNPDHVFRADQLLFFREGVSGSKNYGLSAGANNRGRSTAQRVYYGHAFQLADAALPPQGTEYFGVNPNVPFFQLVPPWADTAAGGQISLSRFDAANPELEAQAGGGVSPIPSIPANQWLFARQSFLLANDGGVSSPYRYLDGPYNPGGGALWGGGVVVTPSIFVRPAFPFLGPAARAEYFGGFGGRVDAAGMSIRDVIDEMDIFASQADQDILINNHYWRRQFVSRFGLYWPRGESRSPSTSRISFPLTRHIIASSCSNFKVEWSWDDGAGAITGFPQEPRLDQGVVNLPNQRWYPILQEFPESPSDERFEPVFRTATNTLLQNDGLPTLAQSGQPIFGVIEDLPSGLSIRSTPDAFSASYEAFFGTNATQPFVRPENPTVSGLPDQASFDPQAAGRPEDQPGTLDISDFRGDWTPWPSAIRVTATIHDRLGRLAAGQTTQFVVDLPRRGVSE